MQNADRRDKPGVGPRDVSDKQYEHVRCATCGYTYQRIDFRSAFHSAFLCPNPKEAK